MTNLKMKNKIQISDLPEVRGKYRENVDLSKSNWFQVGGLADIQFKPEDTEDLSHFIKNLNKDIPYYIIGAGSNIIVSDKGVRGVVIKLGREFAKMKTEGKTTTLGAACLNANVASYCINEGLGGIEFLSGIPGSIGGALAMNAGAYGTETSDVLISAKAINKAGEIIELQNADFNFSYRHNGLPRDYIYIEGTFRIESEEPNIVAERIKNIQTKREETQPIRTRTGGSTFKNPEGHKAWELIDKAGMRGARVGDAQMSEKHCNFMNNLGQASANDLIELGKQVTQAVKEKTGIELNWEIRVIG